MKHKFFSKKTRLQRVVFFFFGVPAGNGIFLQFFLMIFPDSFFPFRLIRTESSRITPGCNVILVSFNYCVK